MQGWKKIFAPKKIVGKYSNKIDHETSLYYVRKFLSKKSAPKRGPHIMRGLGGHFWLQKVN